MLYHMLSLFYLSLFTLSGLCVSRYLFSSDRPVIRIWLGCTFGLVMLLWLPALFSFFFGFNVLAQLLGMIGALCIGAFCFYLSRKNNRAISPWKHELPFFLFLLPFALLGSYLFSSHTIVNHNGSLWVGQSTYGDLSMHLGFITSITRQQEFPPHYSICPDTVIGYPFLCDSVSSTFYTLGSGLRFAAILPSLYAFVIVVCSIYFFFERWMKKRSHAVFSSLLFLVGGGFGFAYFFDLAKEQPDRLATLFTAFYETPTNYTEYGMRWVNSICDMLIPQRATLFGWALLFPALYLLYRLAFEKDHSVVLPLGLLAGSLPLVHTHSFLALGMISAFYFFRSILRKEGKEQLLRYLFYAGIALLFAAPQLFLFTFRQSGSFLRWNWNWDNVKDSFLWFYIKNWGLIFLLLPVAVMEASKEDRAVWAGISLLWLLSETIQFQPNPYDNNKLLFIVFAFHCGIVGKWLVTTATSSWQQKTQGNITRAGLVTLSAIICFTLFCSGILTIGREVVSSYQLIGEDEVRAAAFIDDNTPPDSTFLTYNNHNNAVAVLTGRNIVCGSGSFLHFHGIDYSAREKALEPLFENPEAVLSAYVQQYSIDYVYVGPYEYYRYNVDLDWYYAHYGILYQQDGITIFDLSQALSESGKPVSSYGIHR